MARITITDENLARIDDVRRSMEVSTVLIFGHMKKVTRDDVIADMFAQEDRCKVCGERVRVQISDLESENARLREALHEEEALNHDYAEMPDELEKRAQRIAELLGALRITTDWMQWWLDQHDCECEGSHTCGRQRVEADLRKARALLHGAGENGSPGEGEDGRE